MVKVALNHLSHDVTMISGNTSVRAHKADSYGAHHVEAASGFTMDIQRAWASGSERNTSVFPMLGVTGSRPQFRIA